jgi:hypothetical protein
MVRSKLGLKALGLCALVLGLMAFATSAAQAETGAKWVLINKAGTLVEVGNPSDTLLPELDIKEIEELKDPTDPGKHLVLHSEISKKSFLILCTGAHGTGVKLILNGSTSSGFVVFTGCIVKVAGVTQGACKPHSAKEPEGTIKTEKGHGLIVLSESEGNTLLLPDVGETFVTIILGKEGESLCSVGEKLPVSGKLGVKDCQKLFPIELADHLIEERVALTDLWVLNKTAEHKATILGSAIVKLIGEHEGLKWAGLPA